MVDWYGRWTPETDYSTYPAEKLCDMDRITIRILDDGYKPKTSLENLVHVIMLYFDCEDNYGAYDEVTGCGGYGDSFTVEECIRYVQESGGYSEFDYCI